MITPTAFAQARPGATAETLFQNTGSEQFTITEIFVANLLDSEGWFSLFYDADGTTYDRTTAIEYKAKIRRGATLKLRVFLPLATAGGSIGAAANGNVNITVSGIERT